MTDAEAEGEASPTTPRSCAFDVTTPTSASFKESQTHFMRPSIESFRALTAPTFTRPTAPAPMGSPQQSRETVLSSYPFSHNRAYSVAEDYPSSVYDDRNSFDCTGLVYSGLTEESPFAREFNFGFSEQRAKLGSVRPSQAGSIHKQGGGGIRVILEAGTFFLKLVRIEF